jgi:hypothetical protein
MTLTLPYAGANRIRFEGLPARLCRLSVCLRQTPLALTAHLTERWHLVNLVLGIRKVVGIQ